MLTLTILFAAACFLAYANGANDNFKGVSTLYGSGITTYNKAIWYATLTTAAGSLCSLLVASKLVQNFSGRGLVTDTVVSLGTFLPAVALAAGATVMAAAWLGFPISTTHALTGALLGAGIMSIGAQVNFAALLSSFLLPLLLSPILAVVLAAGAYGISHWCRIRMGIGKEWCVCVESKEVLVPISEPASFFSTAPALPSHISFATTENCSQRYVGHIFRFSSQAVLDAVHFISAGATSFARGLNDTPKITALLFTVTILDIRWGVVVIAVAMAAGGLLNAKKVALTMSKRITTMNHGQGFVANAVTSILVILASYLGWPVSTTHVSCGSLFGIGTIKNQANFRVISQILFSWVLTLPLAAVLGAAIYRLLQ
jgi:PiT family inorganic phosphate transporter